MGEGGGGSDRYTLAALVVTNRRVGSRPPMLTFNFTVPACDSAIHIHFNCSMKGLSRLTQGLVAESSTAPVSAPPRNFYTSQALGVGRLPYQKPHEGPRR